jgi:hypothetical protein
VLNCRSGTFSVVSLLLCQTSPSVRFNPNKCSTQSRTTLPAGNFRLGCRRPGPPACWYTWLMNDNEVNDQNKTNEYITLIEKDDLSHQDIRRLSFLMSHPTSSMSRDHMLARAQCRLTLDLIASIRRFDAASGNLVETTNRLTRRILGLTVLAAFLGAANVVSSGWLPLTWWWHHVVRRYLAMTFLA